MSAKAQKHPITFDQFHRMYLKHLGDPDRPRGYIAYCRAEADVTEQDHERRYASYESFRNAMSIQLRKR